jgi:DNA polymerase III subunit beta
MPADIEGGEVRVRIDGAYLTEALKACGGMVDFKLTDGKSPVLFTVDGYQLVVMPMLTGEAKAGDKAEAKPEDTEQAEPEPETEAEPVTEADTEAAEPETEAEAKPKRSRKREKVAVA